MIKKEREKPLIIKKLQAIQRRLPSNHPARPPIHVELSKRMAGYKGEQALEYHLRFLPKKKYYIYHDLRLADQEHFFQNVSG